MKTRLFVYFTRLIKWLKTFPASLFVGIFLGIAVAVILQGLGIFFAGVVLGVILKELFGGARIAFDEWRETQPLRVLLGPIATNDECYIFFSSYHRDMRRPDEFKLTRWDSTLAKDEILIKGPDLVLGEGDALALALIQSLLARVPKKLDAVYIERGDQQINKWGINSFCIGAHNAKTRVILSKFQKTFFVFDNNYTVITRPDIQTQIYKQTGEPLRKGVYIIPQGDAEPTDFGILLKLKDQFRNNGKIIFVIAGIGPVGTSGAAYFLLTHYDELAKEGDEFGILVQVPSGYQSAKRVEFDDVADYYIQQR